MPPAIPNRYKTWSRQAGVTFALSLAAGVSTLWLPEAWLVPVLLTATLVGTVGFILCVSFWITSGALEGELSAFREGKWLARWTVEQAQINEFRAQRQSDRRAVAWIVGGVIASGSLITAGLLLADEDKTAALWVGAVGLAVAGAGFGLTKWMNRVANEPTNGPPEVYVSARGAVVGGEFVQWRGFGHRFIDAEVDEAERALRIRFGVKLKHGEAEHERWLPVPADKLDEAQMVAASICSNVQ